MQQILSFFLAICLMMPISKASDTLTVGIKSAPPFIIIDKNNVPKGFSIDLLKSMAKTMKPIPKIKYVIHRDITEHLQAVVKGKVDFGIAATTITFEREKEMDFSHPFYRTGLGVLTLRSEKSTTWQMFFSRQLAIIVVSLIIYILVCAHLIWLSERGGRLFAMEWLPGVSQGIWWVIVTMSTVGYGDFVPRKAFSRMLAILIIFTGIVLFGLAIATFTSALTVNNLQSDISNVQDLFGHEVAVLHGTTSELALDKMGIRTWPVSSIEEALKVVKEKRVKAWVHDMPLLRYRIKNMNKSPFIIVGGLFEPAHYGICFPLESPLRKSINIALHKVMEEKYSPYKQLSKRWFGVNDKSYWK